MENKQVFEKYFSRLKAEGLIKALILALIVGFALSIIPSFVALSNNFSGIWFAIAVLFVATGIAFPIIYHLFFRPSAKQIAERIDRLGLEERLITMMELESDESYIAMRQREDAREKLSQIHKSRIRLSIFKIPVAILIVLMFFSTAMVVVSALEVDDKIAWTPREIEDVEDEERLPDPQFTYWTVEYVVVQGSGYIDGDPFQVVLDGEDASPVVAVPFEGWAFLDWFDTAGGASEDPARTDREITTTFYAFARFVPESDDSSEDKNEQEEKRDPNQEQQDNFDPNLIIDGSIYYRDDEVFYLYYDQVMQMIIAGYEVPADVKALVQLYFESIQ